ncbi:MAG TPA: ammonium transporter [Candidatus Sulfotelmatobacter sp.]|nr:ammonium transporter [Candidatus Sulfotelmatobacter sp.]
MKTSTPSTKWLRAALAALVLTCTAGAPVILAADSPPADPTLEQRVADLEAYVNNGPRTPNVASRVAGPGPGHNAWMMTSAALVLFMTLPGLALFYGGLVRRKNVLSVLAQCLGIAGLVAILWWVVGYSLVFAPGTPFIGGLKYAFLRGVDSAPNSDYGAWVSQNVYAMYQLMFAIITPALIVGAIAERMKFTAVLLFVTAWMFLVYFPLAHMVWGVDGLMNGVWNSGARISSIDFAGGTVVHMSSGWSALILCLILGPRIGFRKEIMSPHSTVLCMVGTGMLWVGWYGFNAGSAVGADTIAANAFMTTTLATAVASFTWGALEFVLRKHASVLGFCTGAVAGLVVITPATGFVDASGAVIIGLLAGSIPYLFCVKLKAVFGYDDALDTFGVHAVGGTVGAFATGLLATAAVNPNLAAGNASAKANGLAQFVAHGGLWHEQLLAIGVTLVLAVVSTAIIGFALKATVGLRPGTDVERQGLDVTEHEEEGYIF